MKPLADLIDIHAQCNIDALASLLPIPGRTVGVYENINTMEQLRDRLEIAQAAPSGHGLSDSRFKVLNICDLGVGVCSSVSSTHLRGLVGDKRLSADTPVHLRHLYGGLFLFLLADGFDTSLVKSDRVHVALDVERREIFAARIGGFTEPNAVWLQVAYDGKITTLGKTLPLPYLTSYTIVSSDDFYSADIPEHIS